MKTVTICPLDERESRKSTHMYCKPAFLRTSEFVIVRRIHAAIEKHCWRKNEYAVEARIAANKRLAIRSEARMTLKAVCKAIAYYVCYRQGDNQFEVWADISMLAKQIGAMYLINDSRVRYDVVYNALKQLERMNAVLVSREYDKATKRFKKSRIHVMPAFFRMFGFSDKEVAGLIEANQKYFDKQPEDVKSRLSKLWGRNKLGKVAKARIIGVADKARILWMRKKYKAQNDERGQAVVASFVGGAKNVKASHRKPTFVAANDDCSRQRIKLRDGLSQAQLFQIRGKVTQPGMSAVDVEAAIDQYLINNKT